MNNFILKFQNEESREKAMRLSSIKPYRDVLAERDRQDKQWSIPDKDAGWQGKPYPFLVWLAILGEEFGEVSEAILKYHFYVPGPKKDKSEKNKEELRDELIQVAAVSIAMIEALDATEG